MTVQNVDASQGSGEVHTLSNGKQITLPPHDIFYSQFTVRNRGLISNEDQQRLRTAHFLVAGCGSVGGAVIEPLVRMGAEHLVLAEPDGFDIHNLNRQAVRLQDIDINKAEVFKERMGDINPFVQIRVEPHGITDENVEKVVQEADLIFDAVDVTTQKPLLAKYKLHKFARQYRVPVVAGYDVGGLQMLLVYDYRDPGVKLLHGKVKESQIPTMEPMVFLRKVVPIAAIPFEMIAELGRQVRGESKGFPQIVYTAQLFGVLALPAALDLLAGRPVRRRTIIDVPSALRPLSEQVRVQIKRWQGLYHLNNEFMRSRKKKGGGTLAH